MARSLVLNYAELVAPENAALGWRYCGFRNLKSRGLAPTNYRVAGNIALFRAP